MKRRPHPFPFKGRVIKGKGRGKDLGIPTINLERIQGRIPPYGVYALKCRLAAEEFFGVGSVGTNPTFTDKNFTIELYLFDFDRDVRDEEIEVEFVKKLRDEVAFDTAEDLMAQIHRDIQETQVYFGLEAEG